MLSKIKKVLALVVCVLALASESQSAEHESTFIGILEPTPVHYVGEKSKTPFVIRVAFQYNGVWKTMPNKARNQAELSVLAQDYPKEIDWTIAFDGKNIGEFHSLCPSKWLYYSEIGLEQPDTKAHIPAIKTVANNFCYWDGPHLDRPLVASSRRYVDDPDSWKPLVPPLHPSDKLISTFRKKTGNTANRFRDKQIMVRKCYRSRHGDEMISLAVPNSEEVGNEQGDVQWFYVHGNEISFIGNSLELIDAGDYDHDGRSEVIFHKYGYNYDAYVLAYEGLQKQLEFGWSYH